MTLRLTRRRVIVLLSFIGLAALVVQLDRTQLWADREIYAGWQVQQHVFFGDCRLVDPEGATQLRAWGDDCKAALTARKAEIPIPAGRHLVLLLHGMGRSPFLFRDMEQALRGAGYQAVAISYPSLTNGIAGHAAQVEEILARAEGVERVSFVTHSLGGLVVRDVISRDADWRSRIALGRVVMIAPPNQGSELAEAVAGFAPYHWIGGPSASEIAAGPSFAALPDGVEVAIIAGGTPDGRGFNPLLSENNDGVVTVTETSIAGARDSMTVNALHSFIASAPDSIAATLEFLATGRLRQVTD